MKPKNSISTQTNKLKILYEGVVQETMFDKDGKGISIKYSANTRQPDKLAICSSHIEKKNFCEIFNYNFRGNISILLKAEPFSEVTNQSGILTIQLSGQGLCTRWAKIFLKRKKNLICIPVDCSVLALFDPIC